MWKRSYLYQDSRESLYIEIITEASQTISLTKKTVYVINLVALETIDRLQNSAHLTPI